MSATATCEAGCAPDLHTGPHWRYMDDVVRRQNALILEDAKSARHPLIAYCLLRSFLDHEQARLAEKLVHLKREEARP